MKRSLLIIVFLLGLSCSIYCAQDEYQKCVYYNQNGDSLLYRMLLPDNYDPVKEYPLILFMHGMGEWGNDNLKQLNWGGEMFLNPAFREKYPAIVLFPQTPVDQPWIERNWHDQNGTTRWEFAENPAVTPTLQMVMELLDKIISEKVVDKSRVYVMGLSLGAMATYDLVCRRPQLFAAAIPICGGVNPSRLTEQLRNTRFRIYHGDRDNIVDWHYSRNAYMALRKAGVSVEYFEFKGVDHLSWNMAFNQPDFFVWLFAQKRK